MIALLYILFVPVCHVVRGVPIPNAGHTESMDMLERGNWDPLSKIEFGMSGMLESVEDSASKHPRDVAGDIGSSIL